MSWQHLQSSIGISVVDPSNRACLVAQRLLMAIHCMPVLKWFQACLNSRCTFQLITGNAVIDSHSMTCSTSQCLKMTRLQCSHLAGTAVSCMSWQLCHSRRVCRTVSCYWQLFYSKQWPRKHHIHITGQALLFAFLYYHCQCCC